MEQTCWTTARKMAVFALGATVLFGAASAAADPIPTNSVITAKPAAALPTAKEFCSYAPADTIAELLGESSFKTSLTPVADDQGYTTTMGVNCSFYTTLTRVVSIGASQFKSAEEASEFMNASANLGGRVQVTHDDTLGDEAFSWEISTSIAAYYVRKGDTIIASNAIAASNNLPPSTTDLLRKLSKALVSHF